MFHIFVVTIGKINTLAFKFAQILCEGLIGGYAKIPEMHSS